jgi:hypothetical protein
MKGDLQCAGGGKDSPKKTLEPQRGRKERAGEERDREKM